jgi:flagellar motor protein MotB
MKKLCLLFFLLLSLSSEGQIVVNSNRQKGDSLMEAGDVRGAIAAYETELNRSPRNFILAYNLACAWSADGQADCAFRYLWTYLKADTDAVTLDMLSDNDLAPLHQDERWQAVERDRMKRYQAQNNYPVKDEAFALLLFRLANDDQRYRRKLAEVERKNGVKSKEAQTLWALQAKADKRNRELLLSEVRKKGWPKISDVGTAGASTAFLIVQHSDLATMRKYLPTIKALCESGEARWPDYALLYDRVQMMSNMPQLYGSQVRRANGAQQWTIYPIADEQNLDRRRQKMGLPPMQEYAANWGIRYTSKQNRPRPAAVRVYAPDTNFKRGQRIIFQEKSFTDTRTGDFPLGWTIGNNQCADFNFLEVGRGIVSYVKQVNGERALAVVDSVGAKAWDNRATLQRTRNFRQMPLPESFTIECRFFVVDSSSQRHGGGEFAIFFKEYLAKYRNELNVRIAGSGQFEMNCDANDSSYGPNASEDCRIFYNSYVRSRGSNTSFHHEARGSYAGYDKHSWHALAISYSPGKMRCWLDGRFLGSIASCLRPAAFAMCGVAEFGINNITLAELEEEDELSILVTAKKLVTHAINFEVNRYEVNDAGIPFLREIAGWLNAHKTGRLEIAGHTDSTGNEAANIELSRRRAEAIKAMLHRYGVESSRIVAKGFGSSMPIGPNATEEGRAMNRRVELTLD